ncbi:MAG: hypothetical protein M3277_02875 [Actinomycetota bacterium]|nr:hypothetical protein [Actinomycetota bacterium]
MFVTGFAYPSKFPLAASEYAQNPGTFALDERTLANYEGFCHPTYRMDFSLGGHYVSMHVAVHKEAQAATIENALEILNSIR